MPLSKEEQEELKRLEAWEKTQAGGQKKAYEPTPMEKAYGGVYGLVTGSLGGLGDIESLVTEEAENPALRGYETFFPTTKNIKEFTKKVGIPSPAPGTSGYEEAGELAPAVVAGGKGLYELGKFGARKAAPTIDLLRGRTTEAQKARVASEAERTGAAAEQELARLQSGIEQQKGTIPFKTEAATHVGEKAARKQESALRQLAGVRTLPEAGAFKPVPQTPSEVGSFVRNQAENFVKGIKNRRSELSAKNFANAISEAQDMERVGKFIQQNDKFVDMVKYIDGRLKIVTDPTIRRELETLKTALTRGAPVKLTEGERRVLALRQNTTIDRIPEETFLNPTFEGVEIMRRRIGDAAFGVPEEGYKAIGQTMAKDIYKMLSDSMKDYSKGFSKYLEDYKRLSEPIEVYGTKIGKGLTETVDASGKYYAKTAEQVAKDIFSSPEKVKQFADAVGGNQEIVNAAARRYFAGLVEGAKTPQAIEKLLKDNRAVFNELPAIRAEIEMRYLSPLRQALQRGEASKSIVSELGTLDKELATKLKNIEGSKSLVSDSVKAMSAAKPGDALKVFENTVLPKIRDAEARSATQLLTPQQIDALRREVAKLEQIADKTQRARIIAGILGTYLIGQTATSTAGKLGGM